MNGPPSPRDHFTTPSFVAAAALRLPLSSHAGSASLQRGKACRVCRTRKMKCDGAKPVCGACAKSAVAHGEDVGLITCSYDDIDGRSQRKKRAAVESAGDSEASLLHAKIADLEDALKSASERLEQQTSELEYLRLERQMTSPSSSNAWVASSTPAFIDPTQTSSSSSTTPPEIGLSRQLLPPNWPKDLPSPSLVLRLAQVYFTVPHAATDMINEKRFMHALQRPVWDVGFPQLSLIHAILATASTLVSIDFFGEEDLYWAREDALATPDGYHSRRTKAEIDIALLKGRDIDLLQVTQAMVLLCHYSYSNAVFIQWMMGGGMAMRMASPMGVRRLFRSPAKLCLTVTDKQLNHLRNVGKEYRFADGTEERPSYRKPSAIPPTDDPEVLDERAKTFWFAFANDRFISASTGFAMGIDEDDITTLLPSAGTAYPSVDLLSSPLSPRNPSFFVSNPPHLVQPLQLYFKTLVLFGRILNYLQRSPPPVGMGLPNLAQYADPSDIPDPRTLSAFKRLDSDLTSFRLSIPREFQTPNGSSSSTDMRLGLTLALLSTCTILLHEPFCSIQAGDSSFATCLSAAQNMLDGICAFLSSSIDMRLMPPFMCFCWAVAGRTFVRDLAIRQETQGVAAVVDDVQSAIDVILAALRACRTIIGDAVAHSTEALVKHPEVSLPYFDILLGGKPHSFCPAPNTRFPTTHGKHFTSSAWRVERADAEAFLFEPEPALSTVIDYSELLRNTNGEETGSGLV